MRARQRYRDRDEVEVEILDALVDRRQSGMTIFELRAHVDVDIETIEGALNNLRDDGLIDVEYGDDRSIIRPKDRVLPNPEGEPQDEDFVDWIRRRIRELFGR